MVPGFRPLISIGYNYNARGVLSIIVTEDSGITNSGLPYLSNYLDQVSNVSIFPLDRPIGVYKLSGSVD